MMMMVVVMVQLSLSQTIPTGIFVAITSIVSIATSDYLMFLMVMLIVLPLG